MSSMKYRSVKTPPVCGNISLKDSMKSARAVRRNAEGGAFRSSDKKVGATKLRNNGSRTNTKGASKR